MIMSITFSYGNYLIGIGVYTVDAINKVFFVAIYSIMMMAWSQSQGGGNEAAANAAVKKILRLISRKPAIDVTDDSVPGLSADSAGGAIEFKDIVFRYPTRPKVPVLNG